MVAASKRLISCHHARALQLSAAQPRRRHMHHLLLQGRTVVDVVCVLALLEIQIRVTIVVTIIRAVLVRLTLMNRCRVQTAISLI